MSWQQSSPRWRRGEPSVMRPSSCQHRTIARGSSASPVAQSTSAIHQGLRGIATSIASKERREGHEEVEHEEKAPPHGLAISIAPHRGANIMRHRAQGGNREDSESLSLHTAAVIRSVSSEIILPKQAAGGKPTNSHAVEQTHIRGISSGPGAQHVASSLDL